MSIAWRARLGKLRAAVLGLRPRRWPFAVLTLDEVAAAALRMQPAPIPRILHQIWLGVESPPWSIMQTCRKANPDWFHVVWTDDNLPPLRNRALFDAFHPCWFAQADVLRYEVLFRFGGVYVDADQLCLRGFDDLLAADVTFFAGYQNFGNPDIDEDQRSTRLIANAVIGSAPGHPILEGVIRDIASVAVDEYPWRSVGPAALTRAIEAAGARAVIHPFHAFYPYHYLEEIPEPGQMVKPMHYGSHSVSLWGTTRRSYPRLRRLRWNADGRPAAIPPEFADRHPRLKATVVGA